MICYAKLNLKPDIFAIQHELTTLLNSKQWIPHYNRLHYNGQWKVLPLRSPGGNSSNPFSDLMNENGYQNTPVLDSLPAVIDLLNKLRCEKLSVRLLNLQAGSVIKEHKDAELAFEKGEARLHFPIFTNDKVEFYVEEDRVIMNAGECWYINANLPHRVSNYGTSDRIHLVIDCKVNSWLTDVFQQGEKKCRAEVKDKHFQLETIKNLRILNTTTAIALADQLEGELING